MNPKTKHQNHRHGFTLVEILISLTIMAFITTLIFTAYINLLKVNNRTITNAHAQQFVDQLLLQITQQVQFADQINSPTTDTIIITNTTPTPEQITYSWDHSQNLTQTTDTNSPITLNASDITVTNFQITPRSDPTAIAPGFEILITVSYKNNVPGIPISTYTASTAVSQRNKFSE